MNVLMHIEYFAQQFPIKDRAAQDNLGCSSKFQNKQEPLRITQKDPERP